MDNASLLIFNSDTMETDVISLDKSVMTLGRVDSFCDIRLDSNIVSYEHGKFIHNQNGWFYVDSNSTNGTFIDGRHVINEPKLQKLKDGTILKIDSDDSSSNQKDVTGYIIIFCEGNYANQNWTSFPLKSRCTSKIYIGRDPEECEFVIESPTISKKHGFFFKNNDELFYQDLNSTNGTIVNGNTFKGSHQLKDKDTFIIGNQKMIYASGLMFYLRPQSGAALKIRNLTKEVKDSENIGSKKIILNNINLDIASSELIGILGTSGAGKSTFLNCVNGYEEATSGSVFINNEDFYKNKKHLKKLIGYVPQEDLLRDGLSVKSTLDYSAKLRLPTDTSRKERIKLINQSLEMLGIEQELKSSKIQKLSGGQRKRISIAMELISNPPIIFLDEPTSGLDPETESLLIKQLRTLAHSSKKTLLVITHTLKNIDLFDKILFLGPGGKACYYGVPSLALKKFNCNDYVDIYQKIRDNVDIYEREYQREFKQISR